MNTNSGTRYFYRDPLAAAWMAKHFGIQLIRQYVYPNPAHNYWASEPYSAWQSCVDTAPPDRLYVHANSLHILDPQRDDIWAVQSSRNDGRWWVGPLDEGGLQVCVGNMWIKKENIMARKIIQRDGMSFHWPESEQV